MAAKIVFFGFDGADRAFVDRLIDEGELPNFARLRERSRIHAFENDPAQGASQFWNSASIGLGPAHHGHYFYLQFKPDTYDITPNHESSLPQITPFWSKLDAEGRKVAVLDWHRMAPAPLSNGILVDNWLGHDPLTETLWYPPALAAEAAKHFSGDSIGGGFAVVDRQSAAGMKAYLDAMFARTRAKAAFYVEKLASDDWDVFIACFSEAHDIGHHYYHLDDEAHERYDASMASQIPKPMTQCYRELDASIAKILDAAGPDAATFVYGGPGMETMISANTVTEEMLRRIDRGVGAPLTAAETAKKSYHALIPVKLRRKFAPIMRVVRRKVAKSDFATRRFFAVPHNDNAGAVRINVAGRERFGVIARGGAYDAVVAEIAQGVMTFKNADTGRPIVKRVVCMPHSYAGPYLDLLPDLYLEWDRTDTDRDFRRISSEIYGDIDLSPAMRTGDHNSSGFFWSPAGLECAPIEKPEDITAPVVNAARALGA